MDNSGRREAPITFFFFNRILFHTTYTRRKAIQS